jgi:hypothetical protein
VGFGGLADAEPGGGEQVDQRAGDLLPVEASMDGQTAIEKASSNCPGCHFGKAFACVSESSAVGLVDETSE